ncbi:MAG: glycosyltransferase family 4 protein, partial [bacterium]
MPPKNTVCFLQKVTGIGGTEQQFVRLGRGFTEEGWSCHFGLITESSNPQPDYRDRLLDAGWTVRNFTLLRHLSWSLINEIKEWLKTIEPDILNTHLIHGDLYGRLASGDLPIKKITTKHNDDSFKQIPGFPVFSKWLNEEYDRGITISNHLKTFYEDTLGITSLDFETIHYGLDPDTFTGDITTEKNDYPWENDGDVVLGIV